MFTLGLDIGTTGAKAIVFDETGNQLGYGFQEYSITSFSDGRHEQNAEEIWEKAKKVIKKATAIHGREVGAISLSVQGDAVIPIDKNRHAIGPAQLGMDYRGKKEVEICCNRLGERNIFLTTGIRPHPLNSAIKIMWSSRNDREIFEKAFKYVTFSDFILGKLGSDEIVIDYTQASRTMAFDLKKRDWSEEIIHALDFSKDKLAVPVPSCTVVGTISTKIAEELNISPKAVLVTGGHDQTCAALGAGVVHEKIALDSHGTAEVVSTVFDSVRLNDKMFDSFYPCYCSLIKGLFFTFSLNHTGGVLLKWFAEEFCREDMAEAAKQNISIYEYIFRNLKKSPSPIMIMPYLNGSGTPTCDLKQKGAILGLTLHSDRYDVAKAVLEALSFEVRLNIETMRETEIEIKELRSVGGGARSPFGLQNKADILGIPVSSLKTREAACLGAAIAAGIAVGIYRGIEDIDTIVKKDITYYPNEKLCCKYSERYEIYKSMYVSMKELIYKI